MGNVTANFSRYEFACKCGCALNDPHPVLIVSLQELMELVKQDSDLPPHFAVTGPGRCVSHNISVGGAEDSQHLISLENGYYNAVDGHIFFINDRAEQSRLPLRKFYEFAKQVPAFESGGIGVYFDKRGPRLHLDVRRTGRARWARLNGKKSFIENVFTASDEWEETQGFQ